MSRRIGHDGWRSRRRAGLVRPPRDGWREARAARAFQHVLRAPTEEDREALGAAYRLEGKHLPDAYRNTLLPGATGPRSDEVKAYAALADHAVRRLLPDRPSTALKALHRAERILRNEGAGSLVAGSAILPGGLSARQIRLEVAAPAADPHVPSIISVYPGNDWHEREAWDLMGIVFDGHPHLTRTAMPDDWVGHPQRKDYPLGGIPVEYRGAATPPADTRRSYR